MFSASSTLQITPYDVYAKFARLGQVISICLSRYNMTHFTPPYTILLQSTDMTELRRRCGLTGNETRVRFDVAIIAGDDDKPRAELEPSIGHISGANDQPPEALILHTLNDDCLRAIFESAALSVWHLLSLANVCVRFRAIARQVFPSKYAASDPRLFENVGLWRVEQCFRTFGPLIKALDCVSHMDQLDSDAILRLAIIHCPNIVRLKCRVQFQRTMDALRTLMPTLHELVIVMGNFSHSTSYDAISAETYYWEHFDLPDIASPHLEQLCLTTHDRFPLAMTFFARNPQLKALQLHGANVAGGLDELFQLLPNLQELEVDGMSLAPESSFGRLTHLKRLSVFNADDEVIGRVLNALHDAAIAVERVHVGNKLTGTAAVGDGVIDAVFRLSGSITHVTLINPRPRQLIRIARHLEHVVSIDASYPPRDDLNRLFTEVRSMLENGSRLNAWRLRVEPLRLADDADELLDARTLATIDEIRRDRGIELNVAFGDFY